VKAAGGLASKQTLEWLTRERKSDQPYFVFLNYMEAHRPLFPSRAARQRTMSPAQIEASYGLDFSWDATWEYNFRLRDYSPQELATLVATYDAAIVELDDMFGELLTALRASGQLDNTIVILTSDHGEQLGEHHLLDHQYSAYQPLLRVPLIVRFPPAMAKGHETRPVMTHDLFSTLLELTHVAPPRGVPIQSISLLSPKASRVRISEYPVAFARGLENAKAAHPDFDPAPWNRGVRALIDGRSKLISGTDGKRELYDLGADPGELSDLSASQAELDAKLARGLDNYLAGLNRVGSGESTGGAKSTDDLLGALGYSGRDAQHAPDAPRQGDKPKAPGAKHKDTKTPAGGGQ
jgi:arylsulfatase A-like enzyme